MKKILTVTLFYFLIAQGYGQKLPFQGKLIESGSPVNGTRTIEVSIPEIGWNETHSDVSVTDGLYFIVLGSENLIPGTIFNDADERQMEISVNGTPLSPVSLYKPLGGELTELNLEGPENTALIARLRPEFLNYTPYIGMRGRAEGQSDMLSLEVESWGDVGSQIWENGRISINSNSGYRTNLGPIGMFLHYDNQTLSSYGGQGLYFRNGDVFSAQFLTQNWGNRGHAGTILLRGPNNNLLFEIGNRHWENANLPRIQMRGSTDNPVIELSASNDENETGFISLNSKNNRFAFLNANSLFFDSNGKRMATIETANKGNGEFGQLIINGPNSLNFYLGTGLDPDQGLLDMKGKTNEIRSIMFVKTDEWDQKEKGVIELHSEDYNKAAMIPTQFALHRPDWGLNGRLFTEGNSGNIELRGPNTQNFHIGSAHWENPDKPILNMMGKNNQVKMTIQTIDDANGERGIITLTNNNGDETTYANNGTWGPHAFNMWSGATVHGTLTVHGDINGSGTNNYNSDERLKKEIQPLNGSTLNKIESLGGYSYFWKKEEFPEKNFSAEQQIGLLAQELEAQFPALVKTGDDGFKSVNYNGFTAVLLESVKELSAKVEKLESENRLLHAELSASAISRTELEELKSQMDVLVKMVQNKSDSSSELDIAETNSSNNIK